MSSDQSIIKRVQYHDKTLKCYYVYYNGKLERVHYGENPLEGIPTIKRSERPDNTTLKSGRPKAKNYLANSDLLRMYDDSVKLGTMTDEYIMAMMLLVHKYSLKASFRSYTWLDDMKAVAISHIYNGWRNFDPEKSKNPFAYNTSICHNAFLSEIASQKRQQRVKDSIAIEHGLLPSHGYEE